MRYTDSHPFRGHCQWWKKNKKCRMYMELSFNSLKCSVPCWRESLSQLIKIGTLLLDLNHLLFLCAALISYYTRRPIICWENAAWNSRLFHLLRTRNRLRIVGIFLSSLKKAPEKRLCRHLLIHRQNLLAPYQFNRFCDYFRTKVAKATHRQFTISGQH